MKKIILLPIIALMMSEVSVPSFGATMAPLKLSELKEKSEYVVIGNVSKIIRLKDSSDYAKNYEVTVKVASFLIGKSTIKMFSLRLNIGGMIGFDKMLEKGDQCVFFLSSLKDNRAKLAYWGSFATFDSRYFE